MEKVEKEEKKEEEESKLAVYKLGREEGKAGQYDNFQSKLRR